MKRFSCQLFKHALTGTISGYHTSILHVGSSSVTVAIKFNDLVAKFVDDFCTVSTPAS